MKILTTHHIRFNHLFTLPLLVLVIVSGAIIGALLATNKDASARPAFNAGHIISDQTMRDQTMTREQIQLFLNRKGIDCTSGSNCLKNYKQGGKTAAQIIYDTARNYRINPQVLIVLLQKEVGIVTMNNPASWRYRTAAGYGCPDSTPGVCDSKYYGFTNQLKWAATMFDAILRNSPTWYAPYTVGQNTILYHPHNDCGTQRVNIQNRATAALYSYTPYVPNRAALTAGYGEGDSCSSHGNRNFHFYFFDWFQSTQSLAEADMAQRYMSIGSKLGKSTGDVKCGLIKNGCYQNYENGAMLWTKATGAWESLGSIRNAWIKSGWERGPLGYPRGGEVRLSTGGWYQSYENGIIIGKSTTGYWESKGSIRKRWAQIGYESGVIGYPTGPEKAIPTGGWQQEYEKGVIIGKGSTGYWEQRGNILQRYKNIGETSSKLRYPTSGVICGIHKNGCYQNYEQGSILWTEKTGAWETHGSIRNTWIKSGYEQGSLGFPKGPEVSVPTGGWQQEYEKGVIIGKGSTGYWESKGSIRAHWQSIGAQAGSLGYPKGPEIQLSAGGWQQEYENGRILGKGNTGYWDSSAAIANRHRALGSVTGKLGYPTARTICGISKDGCYQNFQNGAILWTQSTGAWESLGTIRSFWISQGRESGRLGYPVGSEKREKDGSWTQRYEHGTIRAKKGVASAAYR